MENEVELETVLIVKGQEIARSSDPKLWISTMEQITGVKRTSEPIANEVSDDVLNATKTPSPSGSSLEKFADDLGIEAGALEYALSPSDVAPFIQLDTKMWAELKSNSPKLAPSVLAATALVLWARHCPIGDLDTKSIGKVLATVGLPSKNINRALRNSSWLQNNNGKLKLNPNEIKKAEQLVVAYCKLEKPPAVR